MGKINILEPKVFTRIAAGEVVDRPYSVVKELIENSIDAKAKHVEISIFNGGKDLIQVSDDGAGIASDDLPRAILPHATSKIKTAEDIDVILTLGFRGEALASIASVSVLTIISKTEDENVGYKIVAKDGTISDVTTSPSETGTTISVENLFYNTPARAKFLKTSQQEETDITNIVKHLVFANADIAFKYNVDGNTVLQTDGSGLESAFVEVYGYKTISNCYKIDAIKHGVGFKGYIGKPDFTKPNRTYQSVFLNSRYVTNSTIQSAIYNAYAPYLMKRQYPFYVLVVDIPPQFMDVNVHPNKTDVRFADNQTIYSLFFSLVKEVLSSNGEVGQVVRVKDESDGVKENAFDFIKENKSENKDVFATSDVKHETAPPIQDFTDSTPQQTSKNLREMLGKTVIEGNIKKTYGVNYITGEVEEFITEIDPLDKIFEENKKYAEELENIKKSHTNQEEIDYVYDFRVVGQVLSTYIILERNGELFFIDQHAAHERVLYDKYEAEFKTGKVKCQQMLVPYIFPVNDKEYEKIDSIRFDLKKMGFDICDYDTNVIAIYGIPDIVWELDAEEFFNEVLSDKEIRIGETPEVIHDKLAKKACRAAIKSGKKMTGEEVRSLLEDLKYDLTLRCPHGRPIALKITRAEIDKWFKRIV